MDYRKIKYIKIWEEEVEKALAHMVARGDIRVEEDTNKRILRF